MNNEIKQLRSRIVNFTSSIENSFLSTERKNHYLNQIDEISEAIDNITTEN